MNNKNEIEQQKNKSMCSFKCISCMINNISIICSLMGISLFGGIFFGLADLDYGSMCLMNDCAHYLVIVAVTSFFFSTILSKFSKDVSEQTDSVSNQTNVRLGALLEGSHAANTSSEVSKQTTTMLKVTKCDKKTKEDTATKSIKPKVSPKHVQIVKTPKQDKIDAKNSPLTNSCENWTLVGKSKENKVDRITLPLKPSSKTVTPKQAEINSKTLPSNTSSEAVKSGALPQKAEISARTLSKDVSSTIQKSKQKEIGPKTVRPKTFKPKASQNSNEKQLVPYKSQFHCPVPEKKMPIVQKFPFYKNPMTNQSEISSGASTSNVSSNTLKLDARPQEAEFNARTSSTNSPTILQPIGPPKKRSVCPGNFNPKTTQSVSEKVSYDDKKVIPHDRWSYNPVSEEIMPKEHNVPFHQNFKPTYASGCTPATDNLSYNTDSQLFPFNPELFGSTVCEQNIPERPTVPFYKSFMPPSASQYTESTEVLTTKKTTFFDGVVAESQEKYQIQRTMVQGSIFQGFPYLGGGIWSPNSAYPSDQRVEMSPSASRNSDQNKVSDMRTKFESMNMH